LRNPRQCCTGSDYGYGMSTTGKMSAFKLIPVATVPLAVTASLLTIENYYGVFESTEVITSSATIGGATDGNSFTAAGIQSQSFVEQYPDIAKACEMQIRYELDHKFDLEASGIQRESANYRPYTEMRDATSLIPTVQQELDPYRNRMENAAYFNDYQG